MRSWIPVIEETNNVPRPIIDLAYRPIRVSHVKSNWLLNIPNETSLLAGIYCEPCRTPVSRQRFFFEWTKVTSMVVDKRMGRLLFMYIHNIFKFNSNRLFFQYDFVVTKNYLLLRSFTFTTKHVPILDILNVYIFCGIQDIFDIVSLFWGKVCFNPYKTFYLTPISWFFCKAFESGISS